MADHHHDQPPLAGCVDNGLAVVDASDDVGGDRFHAGELAHVLAQIGRHGRGGGAGFDQGDGEVPLSRKAVLQALCIALHQALGRAIDIVGLTAPVTGNGADQCQLAASGLLHVQGDPLGKQHGRDGIDFQCLCGELQVALAGALVGQGAVGNQGDVDGAAGGNAIDTLGDGLGRDKVAAVRADLGLWVAYLQITGHAVELGGIASDEHELGGGMLL